MLQSTTIEQLRPVVADVRAALVVARSAATRTILLSQNRTINFDALQRVSEGADEVGRLAAEFIKAQSALNLLLHSEWNLARDALAALVNPLLTLLFEQAVPGLVQLPVTHSGRTICETVVGLERIHIDDEGAISGTVNTSNSTRSFLMQHGRAHFIEDL